MGDLLVRSPLKENQKHAMKYKELKMRTLCLTFFLFSFLVVNGQSSIKNFNQESVVWLGVDFSLGKFIGTEEFKDLQKIKDHYFTEWNSLTVRESKTDIETAFKLSNMKVNIDNVIDNNNKIKITKYVQNESHRIKEEEIQAAIKAYNFEGIDQEVGLSFFVEFFNKPMASGSIWVALTDIKSKEVFFTKQIDAIASGVGFRNYWQRVIKETIASCKSNFKKWRKGK